MGRNSRTKTSLTNRKPNRNLNLMGKGAKWPKVAQRHSWVTKKMD